MRLFCKAFVAVAVALAGSEVCARDFSQEVEALFRRGQVDSALAASQAFVVAFPDSAEAHGYLGTMYTEVGRLENALAAFLRVTELDGTAQDGYRNLALLQARIGKTDEAVNTLTKGLSAVSDPIPLLLERAVLHGNTGNVESAASDFEAVIKRDPAILDGYNGLAMLRASAGDFDEALKVLDRGLAGSPGNASLMVNKGGILHSKGDVEGAFRVYRSALDASPEDPQVHRAFGFMSAEVGSLAVAEAAWSESVRLNPADLEVRDLLGQLYIESGDGARALEQYEAIVEAQPRAAISRHTLGFLYHNKGEPVQAKREFRACIQLEPTWTEPYKSLAMIHVEEGHLDSALTVYSVALRVDSTDATIHNNIGYVLSAAKQWDAAKEAYEQALEYADDAQILQEVQKNLSVVEAMGEGKFQVRHIVVRTRAKADDLLRQLQDGADFANLAREHSVDPSAADGGNLGFFTKGDLHPEFEAAVLPLEVGELSGVVQTPVGFHIIERMN